ncbi:hypothetical protein J8I34_32915, partial [Cupriavidus sp. AcVe19-6a]|nr:hypothetical protein [Cupriavidus sp. AcVe19-6a]
FSPVLRKPKTTAFATSTANLIDQRFLSAILVGSSLSPMLLNLPSLVHVCTVLVGWGLAIIVTPFSVISVMAARFSGIPTLVISLRANLAFVLVSIGSAALVLGSATWLLQDR